MMNHASWAALRQSLVLCLVNKWRISNAAFDIGGGLGPAKGFGVVVPMGEPVHDGGFETADAIEAAAANSLARNDCEPAFNEFSQDALLGVKCRWIRVWAPSHLFTAGCLWVP